MVVNVTAQQSHRQVPATATPNASPSGPGVPNVSAKRLVAALSALKARQPLIIWGLVFCIILVSYYAFKNNIHTIIRRNDQTAFFQRVFNHQIEWAGLDIEDARNAVRHEDEKMFCTIINNLPQVPYDKRIMNFVLKQERIASAITYIGKVQNLLHQYAWLSRIIEIGSPELIDCYRKNIQVSGAGPYLYAEVFLRRDLAAARHILKWGADPNMTISVDNYQFITERGFRFTRFGGTQNSPRYHIVEKLHAGIERMPDRTGKHGLSSAPKSVKSIIRRYGHPYKTPGIGRIRNLEQWVAGYASAKRNSRQTLYQSASFKKPGVAYEVHPLTIAVLYSDQELTRLLLSAGASVSIPVPNHPSLLDLAATREIYHTLNNHGAPSDRLTQALHADDPVKLFRALKHAENRNSPAFRKEVWLNAIASGSLRCFDKLRKRWKRPKGIRPLASLIAAYQSAPPVMLAYHLDHIVPHNRFYSHKQIRRYLSGTIGQHDTAAKRSVLSALSRSPAKKTKIGEVLLKLAIADKRWAMAYILEDHAADWSDLHRAVLAEDITRIEALLQKKPGRIEERDTRGRTPLALAAQYQCHISYGALTQFKPDINAVDKNGLTPIMHAIDYGNMPMVRNLLEKGAGLKAKANAKCAAALTRSMQINAMAEKIHRYKIAGIPDIFLNYAKKLQDTHEVVRNAADQAHLAACN